MRIKNSLISLMLFALLCLFLNDKISFVRSETSSNTQLLFEQRMNNNDVTSEVYATNTTYPYFPLPQTSGNSLDYVNSRVLVQSLNNETSSNDSQIDNTFLRNGLNNTFTHDSLWDEFRTSTPLISQTFLNISWENQLCYDTTWNLDAFYGDTTSGGKTEMTHYDSSYAESTGNDYSPSFLNRNCYIRVTWTPSVNDLGLNENTLNPNYYTALGMWIRIDNDYGWLGDIDWRWTGGSWYQRISCNSGWNFIYIVLPYNSTSQMNPYTNWIYTNIAWRQVSGTGSVKIDQIGWFKLYNPISKLNSTLFNYTTNGINYKENNTMAKVYGKGFFTGSGGCSGSILYRLDASQFDNYDLYDLYTLSQKYQFTYQLDNVFYQGANLPVKTQVSVTKLELINPTAVNLTLNDIPITDIDIDSGVCTLISYPTNLEWKASTKIFFNFSIIDTFQFLGNLEVISETYFRFNSKLNGKGLVLTNVNYLFNASVLHSYVNNIHYSDAKTFSLSSLWNNQTWLRIDVILGEIYYDSLIETSFTQISQSLTSENTRVIFNQSARTNRAFNNFYSYLPYLVLSCSVLDANYDPISYNLESNFAYFTYSCANLTPFYFSWEINPNFQVSYNVIDENFWNTTIDISFKSDMQLENVTLKVNLPTYYRFWSEGSMTTLKQFSIENLTFLPSIQTIRVIGYEADPDPVRFKGFQNEVVSIDKDFNSTILFRGILEFPNYAKYFRVPVNDSWVLDGIHYQNRSYAIDEYNLFYCEGFDSSITSAYLQFSTNPIESFSQTKVGNTITIEINSSLPMTCNLLFDITSIETYSILNKSDSLTELYSIEDTTYYSLIYIDLDQGMNVITIQIETYESTNWSTSLIIFLGLGGIIGLGLYFRPRIIAYFDERKEKKEKKEKEKQSKNQGKGDVKK